MTVISSIAPNREAENEDGRTISVLQQALVRPPLSGFAPEGHKRKENQKRTKGSKSKGPMMTQGRAVGQFSIVDIDQKRTGQLMP